MTNSILYPVCITLVFAGVVIADRLFGKCGLVGWAVMASIMANVLTAKQITVFGVDCTMGNILFASIFLCTDILSECYGREDATKAVYVSVFFTMAFLVVTQVAVLYDANAQDMVQGSMENLFTFSFRISTASLLCFFLSNIADVALFEKLKAKYPDKLWLRNNVSTILCNTTENFVMMILAFWGIYDLRTCIGIAVSTSLFEIVLGLCDTPFLYVAKYLRYEQTRVAEKN